MPDRAGLHPDEILRLWWLAPSISVFALFSEKTKDSAPRASDFDYELPPAVWFLFICWCRGQNDFRKARIYIRHSNVVVPGGQRRHTGAMDSRLQYVLLNIHWPHDISPVHEGDKCLEGKNERSISCSNGRLHDRWSVSDEATRILRTYCIMTYVSQCANGGQSIIKQFGQIISHQFYRAVDKKDGARLPVSRHKRVTSPQREWAPK